MADIGQPESHMTHEAGGEVVALTHALRDHIETYAGQKTGVDMARVQETKEYFLGTPSTLSLLTSVYEGLLEPQDTRREALSTHAKLVVEQLFEQHMENPEEYASHGADHSLRVLGYMRRILESNPALISKVSHSHGISHKEARFMLENIAVLHDIGYVSGAGKNKAAHSLAGATTVSSDTMQDAYRKIITSRAAQFDRLFHDFRDAILFHNADKVEHEFDAKVKTTKGEFLTDMPYLVDVLSTFTKDNIGGAQPIEVIVPDENSKQDLQTVLGEMAIPVIIQVGESTGKFKGRTIDLREKGDKRLGLEVHDIDLEHDPFQAAIRIADNMDISADRLTALQKEPAFREIYHRFGDGQTASMVLAQLEAVAKDAPTAAAQVRSTIAQGLLSLGKGNEDSLVQQVTPHTAEETWKTLIIKDVIAKPAYAALSQATRERIAAVTIKQDSKEIRHFGGCEAITDVTFLDGKVRVTVDEERYQTLNRLRFTETVQDGETYRSQEMGVGEYQLWRAKGALDRIQVGGKQITIVVVNAEGDPVPFPDTTKQEMPVVTSLAA